MTIPAPDTWIITRRRIPWEAASSRGPVLPLGRNVGHDSRNLAYPWKRQARTLTSQMWTRHIPVLDQGQVGSCTGNAEVGSLGTDPDFGLLVSSHAPLDEALALAIYSAAESIDGDGPYPPNDNGSTGPSAAKAAMKMGLISGYLHCLSLADVLDALEEHPVCIGSNWYDSMDRPDSSGLVSISPGASVRGGHEYLARGKDMSAQVVHFDNSWGTGFGVKGTFSYSFATLERLLHEQGDGTVSLPLTTPAPTPVPVPTPTPAPVPAGGADQVLHDKTLAWTGMHHVGQNAAVARDLKTWYAAKGF